MTLVDNNEVEKGGRDLAKKLIAFLWSSNRLIQAQIDLIRGVDLPPSVYRVGEVV